MIILLLSLLMYAHSDTLDNGTVMSFYGDPEVKIPVFRIQKDTGVSVEVTTVIDTGIGPVPLTTIIDTGTSIHPILTIDSSSSVKAETKRQKYIKSYYLDIAFYSTIAVLTKLFIFK